MNLKEASDIFVNRVLELGISLEGFTVYKNGRNIISAQNLPYRLDDAKHVYSLSKSFCSTAFGLLYDRGIIDVNERIADIFPEKLPKGGIGEKMSQMTVSHALSMNTGHEKCVMHEMVTSDDPAAAFLRHEPEYAPGTHFTYNTGATFLVSACITKRTGLTAHEVLQKYLFPSLGIENTFWKECHGISEGGVGFSISCKDAAKLGLLYLQNGVYGGKRLLSEKYIGLATSAVSDNGGNGNPDWCAGYGYQFWKNYRGGYRADGAFGQAVLVLPERDTVIAFFSEGDDFQGLLDAAFALSDNIEKCADNNAENSFCYKYEPVISDTDMFLHYGEKYLLDKNGSGSDTLCVNKTDCGLEINLGENTVKIQNGAWMPGIMRGENVKPTLAYFTATHDEPYEFYACADVGENRIDITLLGKNCPNNSHISLVFDGGKVNISGTGKFCDNCNFVLNGKISELK